MRGEIGAVPLQVAVDDAAWGESSSPSFADAFGTQAAAATALPPKQAEWDRSPIHWTFTPSGVPDR